ICDAAALLLFGGAERKIGTAHQLVTALAVARRMREARRDANLHHLLVDPERPRKRADERRHRGLGRGNVRPGNHEREFIAIETATERAWRQNIFDARSECFEKLVADA